MDAQLTTPQSFFFAYASVPNLRAEAMREAADECVRGGIEVHTWEDLQIEGRLIIDSVLEMIDRCDGCVAEISASNPNVLFEAGYALARGKKLFFAIDESDEDATRAWSGLQIIDTIGRINYEGNAHILARRTAELATTITPPLIETLLTNARPREANAVFAPGVPHKFNSAERLERLLERKTDLKLLAAQDELGLAQLSYYVEEIYRSSAAILHFMKPTRIRGEVYNGRLAFLAGIVRGLDLPLLMVAEEGYHPPLDYKDLMFVYSTSAKLTDHVSNWLANLPSPKGSNKRLGRLKLDIELPVRTFGQFVAESEEDSLTNYFVHTNEFEAVLTGRATVFTGRKGTGKTATMQQAVEELRTDRRILVVPIKPSSYDLSGLLAVLGRFEDPSTRDYFLLNLWSFLLTSEVALRALLHAEDLPAGLGGDDSIADLAATVERLAIDRDSDLSSRLDDAVAHAMEASTAAPGNLMAVSESLRVEWNVQILPPLKRALHRYDRVAVLVDNLDKTWERGVDFGTLSQFLLSLLVTSGRFQSELRKSKGGQPSVNLTLTAFLRTDIYDVMAAHAREPDKINPQSIQWHDEELLIRVLEERFLANQSSRTQNAELLWSKVFAAEVHSQATRDYFLWRALPRPRDIIFLGNAALTTAINRRHSEVLAQDFAHAEGLYSRFAVEALLVESEAQGFDLEGLLFEFAGLESTLTEEELRRTLATVKDADAVRNWLIRTSFLGLETRDGSFVHVEGESEARKKLKAAQRLAQRLDRPLRYRVHPAFRPYLDVRDDDVHTATGSGSLEDENV
ncbi:hypothetical protein KV100_10625 [Mumia sp. zg.B21]|uniref:P-loop ATPase, Sll1717 family n=1 Tax=Mumia sp. zg.B21 TaxID=2855447 RepID=UPI001C6E762B|nr:hypothetical protein [Mumia sp. zg.B21]MBW9210114.1 hypothetical protein [Mumia sp. zg.B21]